MTASGFLVELGTRKRETGWLIGNGRTAKGLLERLGIPHLWDHERKAWMFPAGRAEDIAAYQHLHKSRVEIVTVER